MMINASCTQAVVQTVFTGCETCDAQGNCSGCGSVTCSPPAGLSVRSTQ
jgi:hypothetical protein